MITIKCHNGRAQSTVEYGFNLQEAVDNYPSGHSKRHESVTKDMYACAFLPPNYPVPAIRLHTYIDAQGGAVYQERTNGNWSLVVGIE